jgi:hypothetical protein
MAELMTVRLAELVSARLAMAVCLGQKQWEKTKRKGRCECHASGDGDGQSQNYGYLFHGRSPSSSVIQVPEQGSDFRDCHHVLELLLIFCGGAGRNSN